MKYVATFDIGTTAVKGVLVSTEKKVVFSLSMPIETLMEQGIKEQRPVDWYHAFCNISKAFLSNGFKAQDILGIVMSGQMQDLITVDQKGYPVMNAILYSDGRAQKEADIILNQMGSEEIIKSTGNFFDGSMPLAKLLWLKRNDPVGYNQIHKILISSKDYCIARLTGQYVTDVTSASTAGLMDIYGKSWNTDWVDGLDLDANLLPDIKYAQDQAGVVTDKASFDSGYAVGTPVYTGTGDAGATTLASGISKEGEFNINIGTSGWIACMNHQVRNSEGVFNLAAMPKDKYINVVPFLNAGGVHKWVSKTLTPENEQESKYEYIGRLLNESQCGSNGLLFLPYLLGERFPVMDVDVRGCYIGLSANTTKNDLARASLEGVAFSIKQGLEAMGGKADRVTLIGGGAQVEVWCQALADVLGQTIYVSADAEYMPAISIAASVLVSQGMVQNYESFISTLMENNDFISYEPIKENVKILKKQYAKYINIYPQVKNLF